MIEPILYGPFKQLIPMDGLSMHGPLSDNSLKIIEDAGVLIGQDKVLLTGSYMELNKQAKKEGYEIHHLNGNYIALPGFIDAHTHICYAGSRSEDFASRLSGKSYAQIAASGGGIWNTVTQTRESADTALFNLTRQRALSMLQRGITTAEVKSGYGLSTMNELRILHIIREVNALSDIDLIPTCLAAHTKPKDFIGSARDYLNSILFELLPVVQMEQLAERVDIFIDESGFSYKDGLFFLKQAKKMGFKITVHADQFSTGGSSLAVEMGAISADHLEASGKMEIDLIAKSGVIAVCLPGASLGMGLPFAPARKILDAGASLVIASDWNPGTAPMGDLLVEACLLGNYEHLTVAETLAAITFRAAAALNLPDRGILKEGFWADMIAFQTEQYKDIVYHQGMIRPSLVWKRGKLIHPI